MIHPRSALLALGSLICLTVIVPACSDSETVTADPGLASDAATDGSAGTDGSAICTLGSGQALCQLCVNSRCLTAILSGFQSIAYC